MVNQGRGKVAILSGLESSASSQVSVGFHE